MPTVRKKPRLRIGFDTNNWVSFCIGQKLYGLKEILLSEQIRLFACDEIQEEFEEVVQRPELQKFVRPERVSEALELMRTAARWVKIRSHKTGVRDPKDNFLISFAFDANLDYLITGDRDLLTLRAFDKTRIVTFAEFLDILRQY
jgi:hypothetical protein